MTTIAYIAEAAAMDAEADGLLKEARPLLEAASQVLREAGLLHRDVTLATCKEAAPILARVADLRFGARIRRGEHSLPSRPAKATPAAISPPSPPKETTVTTPNPAEAAALAERARQQAEDALVSGIVSHVPGQRTAGGRSYSPGVPLTSLRSLAAEEPVRANPAADVDELVASIVAFIPRDRLANGAGLDVDED